MPKISAPTVAEHRVAQRAALLTATEHLLVEAGLAGVTPRSIAERAGLARSSFYEYFGSRDDILAAVAIAAFDRWAEEIDDALAGVPESDRMRAYVEATMRMTADGKHSIASILQQADISPTKYDDIMALHTTLLRPINTLLRETGVPDPDAHATLIQGLLNAGVQLVTHGVDPDAATAMIAGLLAKGLPADAPI
ncbi:TetR/AcrR family transcriptional regulator [Leifsonia sp. NCR5]|uniref:TetR/AcrR family transcriptional regulator n=1 Tax=Leifsonia sp. NCR5 TaxID=1978342 RepID=UPI000A19284F|nr:TetR/AcrR family transcriptional regulator [Leifsonia sp. NCR5]